jgi:hypothetical protein
MVETCPYPRPTAENVCTMESLLYFVWEREVIRIVKERGGEKPWTNDPVFEKYKFTNIHRRDDRVSKWIIKEIINLNLKDKNLWFSLLIARLVNWPPTLERLLYEDIIPCPPEDFDGKAFSATIENFKKASPKVYGGAYMVYPTKLDVGKCKSYSLAKHIISAAIEVSGEIYFSLWRKDEGKSVQSFVDTLSKCYGISTFMAGQVASDLSYAKGHLDDAEDLYTFAPMGPGSMRGLNYLQNRKPFAGWQQDDFNQILYDINKDIAEELRITDLTLHDVQNVMCEYGKYCRVVLKEGVPKTLYKPEMEF